MPSIWRKPAPCLRWRKSCTSTRTAGGVRIPFCSVPPSSGSARWRILNRKLWQPLTTLPGFPDGEKGPHHFDGSRPQGLVYFPAAPVGRAHPDLLLPGLRRAIDLQRGNAGSSELFRKQGSDQWYIQEAEEILPQGTVCPKCGGRCFDKGKRHYGRMVRFGREPCGGVRISAKNCTGRPICIWKARISTVAGSSPPTNVSWCWTGRWEP